jgi:hypothetical protein
MYISKEAHMIPYRQPEGGRQEYQMAVDFWTDWYQDPNSDIKYDLPPTEVIERTLIDIDGAHPREASWISRQALNTVIERMEIGELR